MDGCFNEDKGSLECFHNPNISVRNLSVNFQVKMGCEHKDRDL